jgi:uncharacterized protein DUF7009
MKLRIHENSLRLRLTQKEVAEFRSSGRVDAAVSFAAGRTLSYSLQSIRDASEVSADLNDCAIRVVIPIGLAIPWADSDQIGIQAWQTTSDGARLELVIEKDFQCLHQSAAQDPDAYPNPLTAIKP